MWSQGRQFETGAIFCQASREEMRLEGRLRRAKGAINFLLTAFRAGRVSFGLTVDSDDTGMGNTVLGVFEGGKCVRDLR